MLYSIVYLFIFILFMIFFHMKKKKENQDMYHIKILLYQGIIRVLSGYLFFLSLSQKKNIFFFFFFQIRKIHKFVKKKKN
jgi:hypothetical protein